MALRQFSGKFFVIHQVWAGCCGPHYLREGSWLEILLINLCTSWPLRKVVTVQSGCGRGDGKIILSVRAPEGSVFRQHFSSYARSGQGVVAHTISEKAAGWRFC